MIYIQEKIYWKDWSSRGAGTQSETLKSTGCGFDPHSRRWNIYLNLYFYFFALVSRQKRGVEFRRSTRNTSRTRRKLVLTLGSVCLPCCVRDTALSWFDFIWKVKSLRCVVCCVTKFLKRVAGNDKEWLVTKLISYPFFQNTLNEKFNIKIQTI